MSFATSIFAAALAVALPHGTPVRVMVTTEVTSRTAKPGDTFAIIVDSAVIQDGRTLIPAGTRGIGTVITARPAGIAGVNGQLTARLAALTLGNRSITLAGGIAITGASQRSRIVAAAGITSAVSRFASGTNAILKAGEIIDAELAEDFAADAE